MRDGRLAIRSTRSRVAAAAATTAALATAWAVIAPSTVPFITTGQSVAAQGNGQSNSNCVANSNGNGNCLSTFGVTVGSVNPIYPTQTRSLPVTVSNPNSFEILIDSYTATVRVPSGSACPASSLTVPAGIRQLTPVLAVAKNGSAAFSVPVTLPNSVPDSCQRVPFSVTVAATAVKK